MPATTPVWTYDTFEYGNQSGLHAHIYKMTQGECKTLLRIRIAPEREIA